MLGQRYLLSSNCSSHIEMQDFASPQSCIWPSQTTTLSIASNHSPGPRMPIAGLLCYCHHASLDTSIFQSFPRIFALKHWSRISGSSFRTWIADLRSPITKTRGTLHPTFRLRPLKHRLDYRPISCFDWPI